ncbi:MAG: HPr(Ser) kinase/phosphatase [Zetaproteobacteria bacterium]|nr:MAG: HPr(Ser) kinase/phosphatase [Zetaproteobacteria bacterium]
MTESAGVSIRSLLKQQGKAMDLRLIAGAGGLDRVIEHPRINTPSLAFAGFLDDLDDCRLQVIGQSELGYLSTRPPEEQRRVLSAMFAKQLAGVVVTRNLAPPPIVIEIAERTHTPLLVTSLHAHEFMSQMMVFLSRKLAPACYQHGVYMDVFGLGVLLIGKSGIGKSEIGLELISRGHRLVADDMVELVRQGPDVIVGHSPESLRYHMEIRGLGVLNIRDMFGAAAITDAKRLRLVIELVSWERAKTFERLPLGDEHYEILGVPMPKVHLPIRPGRSLAILVEVATRNQLMKLRGIDSNKQFMDALDRRIRDGGRKGDA